MRARLPGVLLGILLIVAALLLAAARTAQNPPSEMPPRRGGPPPNSTPAPDGSTAPGEKRGAGTAQPPEQGYVPILTPATPGTSGKPGTPGTATPPEQGYVPPLESPTPGTASSAAIQSDPQDRAYWELYDRDKRVTLTGKITRIDWGNPNTYIYLSTDGALWAVESGFIQFSQSSVTPPIRVDETITVSGYFPREEPIIDLPARIAPGAGAYLKNKHLIRAGEITTAYGQKLDLGKPPTDKELSERLKCTALGC